MTTSLLDKDTALGVSDGTEDGVRQFLQEIRQYPRLTPQQERQIAMACAAGDEEAVRKMVNSNLRLVVSIAWEYAGRGVHVLDLIQEGSIGLFVAAKRFDYTRENRFSTYATKWIRKRMLQYLADNGGLVRVPEYTAERMRRVQQAQAALLKEKGRAPTLEELAKYCDIPEEKISRLLDLNPEICSLDAPVGDEDEGTLGSILEDVRASKPEEELVRKELRITLDRLLSTLTPRQQQVLRLRSGMADGKRHSLAEIGTELGISKERARQIERQAMDKLQKLGAGLGLEDFLA